MSVPVSPLACLTCGAEAPESARFCPQCGTRIDRGDGRAGDGLPPDNQLSVPVTLVQAERRMFGLAPPALVFAIALFVFFLAVFFMVLGHGVLGAVLLVVAIALGAFFVSAARRLPQGRLAGVAVGVSNEVRGRAGFAWVSLLSWSSAGREVVRLRGMQRQLRREQGELIRALGEAVYREDERRAEALKEEARARGERIDECERELRLALEAARTRVGRERLAIQPTQALAAEQAEALTARASESDSKV